MNTKEEVLNDYYNYLQYNGYTETTCHNYKSQLKKYMELHQITNTQELTTQIRKETHKIRNMAPIYKYLNIQPPIKKRQTPTKEYKKKQGTGYDPHQDKLILAFQKERNVKDTTMPNYFSSLKLYIPYCGFKNAQEMINEALEDEKNRVPIKEARITEHLRGYKRHLQEYEKIKTSHSLHTYFTKIETFYRHFQVTVPARPPMQIKKEYSVGYYDLPDKQMIETAIEQSDIQLTAIIYFMSSSGTAKAETINLTVKQFIEGLREYTQHTDPEIVVQELQNRKDLVPLISMLRKKTNIPYYTCCSPEATHYILQYMQIYERYNPEEPLFEIGQHGLMKKLSTINDNNNWGRVGSYRRFRSHMLRKYHASNIGCAFEIINTLEGRTNGTIHETYVKLRPDKLKEIYMEHMHNVMIHPELYEGPHCGSNTLKAKVQNTVESILEQKEAKTENQNVVPSEPRQTENNNPYTPTENPSPSNMSIELYKEIGKLEAKIEMLEERIRKLEGGIKI